MREWIRSRERAAYRVLNAGILVCMVLFGAENALRIGGLTAIHFIVAFAVLGVMTGINYMTVRGRILCLAVLVLLFCACLAAGPGGSPAFWQSFFSWLIGRGAPPQEWEAGYGLLQTAIFAVLCYLAQILFEKVPPLKIGAAVGLLSFLIFCLLTRWNLSRFGAAFLICFILLVWEEWVQKAWDKKRGKGSSPEAHTFWILFFWALYLGILTMIPAPEKPYDWMWAKNIYHQLQESVLVYIRNVKWGDREGFGMAFTGFSQEGTLGGDLQEEEHEVMRVQVQSATVENLYLTGMVYDSFDGREWSQTAQGNENAVFLDTAQALYTVRNYDRDYQGDYLREVRVDIQYGDFSTGYLFAPLKTWVLEEGKLGGNPEYACEDGTLRWNGQKGYGTEYGLRYFEMNAGEPQFDLFLEDIGRADLENREGNREVWELLMIECERRLGCVFTLKDLEDYRKEVYERYLGQAELSSEMEEYLGEIVGDAETDLEKLRAIERRLSALTYTLTPGELPDGVWDAGSFLDFFLLESRQGYCTYFATAFVLLARAEGIPARYVQGYCVPIGDQGEARVYSYMAHAWPEAYLDGIGWVPFEPTPGYGGRRYGSWEMRRTAEEGIYEKDNGSGERDSYPTQGTGEEDCAPDTDGTDEAEEEDFGGEAAQGYSWRLFGFAGLLVLCACGILLALDNALGRYRYKRMEPEERLRAEVLRNLKALSYFGLEREEWETLEEFRERAGNLPGLCEEGREPPLRFTENYERTVYGGEIVGEDMIKETVAERESLLELLKEKRKWVWLCCQVRLYLGRYRF